MKLVKFTVLTNLRNNNFEVYICPDQVASIGKCAEYGEPYGTWIRTSDGASVNVAEDIQTVITELSKD